MRDELGDWPIIVSLANGIDNQRILPKLFSKVIYGVVVYNARRDTPVVVGFQDKGPLLIGTLDNTLGAELEMVRSILGAPGCRPRSSTGCRMPCTPKIVINLTNALDALVGRGWRPLSDLAAYQQLLSQTLWRACASCAPPASVSTAFPAFRRLPSWASWRGFPAGSRGRFFGAGYGR